MRGMVFHGYHGVYPEVRLAGAAVAGLRALGWGPGRPWGHACSGMRSGGHALLSR